MTDTDSIGAQSMRALARRLDGYAEAEVDPARRHDLKQAGELIAHLEKLTAKLAFARPGEMMTK